MRAIVTSRAKSPARLEIKVKQRFVRKAYQTVDDIFRDIVDLAGVRVALYFPGEREQVSKIISQLFLIEGPAREFPSDKKPSYSKRFSGYSATHFRVRLRDASLNEAQKRYAEALIEIQIASVLMHAWAEVEHDLVYKPLHGELSDDEYSILDELNGLVIAGEIALERLQKAGEKRVAGKGRSFANHYDLASYLLDRASPLLKGPASEAVLGRIDVLYELIKTIGFATPERLQPYVSSLSSDFESRPISEQIIDRLLAEDSKRYKIYEQVRSRVQLDREGSFASEEGSQWSAQVQTAFGRFLFKWITFERALRKLGTLRMALPPQYLPTAKLLETFRIFDAPTIADIDRIRRLRNSLVHGTEIPQIADLQDAAVRLDQIVAEVKAKTPSIKNKKHKTRRNRRAS